MKLLIDKYKTKRGGHSRALEIHCESCGALLCYYQKDGPGILKRMYLDRIFYEKFNKLLKNTSCPKCKEVFGTQMIYKKENRKALRLFAGSVTKKIVSAQKL